MRRQDQSFSSLWAPIGLLSLLWCAGLFSGLALAAAEPGAPICGAGRLLPEPGNQAALGKPAPAGLGRLPLYFLENRGQMESRVKFYEKGAGQTIYFTRQGIDFALLKGTAGADGPVLRHRGKWADRPGLGNRPAAGPRELTGFRLTPVGMSPKAEIVALEPQAGKVSYYRGNDPGQWQTGLPSYRAVAYRAAYPGIDLKFYGVGPQLEYDIIVQPGANPRQVKFQYAGVKGLEITPAGDLTIKLPDGSALVQKKPLVYQEVNGARVARDGRFKLLKGKNGFSHGFEVASYDKRLPLIIDPVLVYSAYLGGSGYDAGNAIAVDQNGFIYVTGTTYSSDFPTSSGSLSGSSDAFVTKLSPAGDALVYCVYLGSNWGSLASYDSVEGYGIAVDNTGNAYVTGFTNSSNFPTVNPFQAALNGNSDAFVAEISPDGQTLVYSSYLGNSSDDTGYAIAVNGAGVACVAGETFTSNNLYDAFVAKVSVNAVTGAPVLVYNKTLGGSNDDTAYAIAMDKNGNAYLAGETQSANFPCTNALQANFGGVSDAFVAKFDLNGNLTYSTFLGGSGTDAAYSIAVDLSNNIYVAGETYSTNFPLKNACRSIKRGDSDAFVAKINASGATLSFSTLLGQPYDAAAYGLALDSAGNAYLTGRTSHPVYGFNPPVFFDDAFVARVSSSGRNIGFFSFGGSDDDWGNGIALDSNGNLHVTGETWSGDFPVIVAANDSWQNCAWLSGGADAFITKIQPPLPPLPGNPIAALIGLLLTK